MSQPVQPSLLDNELFHLDMRVKVIHAIVAIALMVFIHWWIQNKDELGKLDSGARPASEHFAEHYDNNNILVTSGAALALDPNLGACDDRLGSASDCGTGHHGTSSHFRGGGREHLEVDPRRMPDRSGFLGNRGFGPEVWSNADVSNYYSTELGQRAMDADAIAVAATPSSPAAPVIAAQAQAAASGKKEGFSGGSADIALQAIAHGVG